MVELSTPHLPLFHKQPTVLMREKFIINCTHMFLIAGVILIILWFIGFFLKIAGGLIHIALVLAIISIIVHFVTGKKTA
jgi:uncharacterized membrane protein (DUF485 family)